MFFFCFDILFVLNIQVDPHILHASCLEGSMGKGGCPPSGVRLSISVCPIELISPLHPCPVPTAPLVGTVLGWIYSQDSSGDPSADVQVRVEERVEDERL